MKKKLVILLFLSAFCGKNSNDLKAQTPFSPNTYSGWVSTPTNLFATIPSGTGATFTQITRGSGNSFSTAADGFNSSKWNNPSANAAITANQHLTFSVSSDATSTLEVDSLVLIFGRSNAGPDSCILQYRIASNGPGFNSVSSGVGVILTPAMSTTTTLSFVPPTALSLLPNDTLIFRLVAWHASSTLGTMKLMNNSAVYGKTLTVMSNSITSPLIQTSNAICVSSIQGDSVQVSFNSTGVFNPGNSYSLELSDASGSFSTPLVIGNNISNSNSGTIQGFIPAGTASSNYRLRITSSDPVTTGLDTTQLMIHPGMILTASTLQPDCPDSTGAIALAITGGSGTIEYDWSNGGTTPNLTGLAAGVYTVNISDAAGCSRDTTFSIQAVPNFSITETITDATCHSGSTGSIQLSVAGGTTPYSISWTGNGINQTGLLASNLQAGIYSAQILDANNCPYTDTYTVTEPLAIEALDSIVNASCHSESNGSVHISVTGGTAPYSISWTGNGINQTGPVASNLSAGNYDLQIVDAQNCVFTSDFDITEPATLNLSATIVHATCSTCNGSITLSASGGVAPYTYLWFDNSTSTVFSAVPGQYCVEVSDLNGCESDTCFTISSTAGIETESTNHEILVFPNPTSNVFNISFASGLNGLEKELVILNSLGEVVLKETIQSNTEQFIIEAAQWPAGLYLYQIQLGTTLQTGKINLVH